MNQRRTSNYFINKNCQEKSLKWFYLSTCVIRAKNKEIYTFVDPSCSIFFFEIQGLRIFTIFSNFWTLSCFHPVFTIFLRIWIKITKTLKLNVELSIKTKNREFLSLLSIVAVDSCFHPIRFHDFLRI
jgi:hypothetical protein